MNLQSKAVMRQEQKLKMTPQLYQAIKLMSLPLLDLRTTIQEEIEKNPALEIIEDKTVVSINDITKKNNEEYSLFEDTSDPGYPRYNKPDGNEDTKRKFIEGTLSRPESLQDHLLWQLRLQPIPKSWAQLGEMLISNLDENGFHIESPEKLIREGEVKLLEQVIKIIQTFDPIGVCTGDYKEALLVQIRYHSEAPPNALSVVENYMDLLEKGKYKIIASKMKISEKEVLAIVDFLSELEPLPGRNYATDPPTYVIPDVMVRLKDGEFVLILNDEEIPVLGINPFFTDIMGDERHKNEKDLNNFVNSSIKNAKWFIQSIKRRNETLVRVCRAIVEFQRDFFRKGPKYLVPLTLRDIAEEVGVHDSTISRISNGKYIQTEWGIFELKFFFSSSVPGNGLNHNQVAKQSVKIIIKEIIEKEGAEKHLSDKKIADMLEERGIKLARRTVAKYRKELDIMSSYDR
ncbi:MAG: RNA polymerase factor sigma-54 [Spirochaetales bacterium]|nr:RNA polymerase factor sigma-54 [Spirochaetales bacterium]